ncbi:MAG TPA: hypothetical protein DCP92_19035 [Nitrospiraceae bacterium]|nr:hypothetical protein [Nitrospiraceae bacterium]
MLHAVMSGPLLYVRLCISEVVMGFALKLKCMIPIDKKLFQRSEVFTSSEERSGSAFAYYVNT